MPELPVETVMQILEEAVLISLQSAAAVSLVSSWTRKIALPHLFRTIIHRKSPLTSVQIISATRSLSRAPTSRMSLPDHLGRYVRNLWTESIGMASPTSEIDIFHACTNVQNIALPSAALRALYVSCRSASKQDSLGIPQSAFPSSIRQITLITHTQRYEWHFLDGLRVPDGSLFLHNITHLHMLDMQVSAFVPHAQLPNLTHLSLPYLDLGANISQDILRLPDGVLDHPSLQMIVLTINATKYLHNPWYHIPRFSASGRGKANFSSPRNSFRMLVKQARETDERVHVIIAPNLGQTTRGEWEAAAMGGENIWDKAASAMNDDNYGAQLPEVYSGPAGSRRPVTKSFS